MQSCLIRKIAVAGLLMMAGTLLSFAQVTVTGTVTDAASSEPLIGVSIAVEGTTQGVVTDLDGKYSIDVDDNAVLVFGYLGYSTVTETVGGRAVINVAMEQDINLLDAVVLMGYSSTKKTELSSSVVSVGGNELRDVTTPDLGNMLQGKAAGVLVYNSSGQPGSSATIRVRGTGSITAASDPLYVVDGIPGGSFNPNDVESITVLKDAGATALYGSDAAGGVIVVTTKKAQKGQKVTAEFKAQAGVKQALFGRFSPMNSEELYDYVGHLYSSALMNTLYPESLLEQDYNWMDEAFQLGTTQDYYASVAGSEGKVTYFVSLDHYREKGTLINTNYKRTTGRVNLGAQLAKNLDMNVRLNYSDSRSQEASSYVTLEGAYRMLPWDNPLDERTGEPVYINSATRPDNGGTWYSHDKYNFLHNELYNTAKSDGMDLTADLQLSWRITDWLTLTSTNRFDGSSSVWKSVIDPRTNSPAYPTGYISKNTSFSRSFSTSNLLKFNKTFKQKHNLNALLGYEWGQYSTDYTVAEGNRMPIGMTSLNSASPVSVGGYQMPGEGWSVFGQVQYSYDEKYIVSATLRADASSVFAPNNRVGYFPSVSAAWLMSKEGFMQNQDVISFLKIRASYGETGNASIEPFLYLDTYSLNSLYQGVVSATPTRLANPNLKWETAQMTNVGFDISFRNFLEVNVDLYNIDNTDLLLDVPTATSSGYFSRTENAGRVRNQGIEIQLNSTNFNRKNFSWTTGFNIGFNKNTVVDLPSGDIMQSANDLRQIIREGEPLYSWYMPKWAGVDPETGSPLWEELDENGNVVGTTTEFNADRDSQIVGCASPLFSGGLVNTLRYKNLSLSFNFNFVYGNDIYNYTRITMDSDGAYSDYNQMSINNGLGWSRWEEPGDIATHPKLQLNGNNMSNSVSSRYLEDGSYLRLKNVTLSYTLPKKALKKMKMQDFRIFLSGDNLFTVSKFSGTDPEVRLESTDYELAGMFSMNYPVGRVITLGVNFKF